MDSEATCSNEAAADSVVDVACTAPQTTVPNEIASSKPVSNVDEEAVAFIDDDLDTEFNVSAFVDNGDGSDGPKSVSNLETAEARIKELEGQLFNQRSESWKRETEICNAFRKCAEELDQANKTIAELKTELDKAKEPKSSVDAQPLNKELAERAAECEKLKEQLKQEKEQSLDLARKVGQLRHQLLTVKNGRNPSKMQSAHVPRVPTVVVKGADTVYPIKRSRWEPNGNYKRYWNGNIPPQSHQQNAAKRSPLRFGNVITPSNTRASNGVTDLEDGEILIDNDNNSRSPSPKRQNSTSSDVDVMKSRIVGAKQIV